MNFRMILWIAVLGFISFFVNFVCYHSFYGSFIFIDNQVIVKSTSDNSTFRFNKYYLNHRKTAKQKFVGGFSYPNPQICPDLGTKLKVVAFVISAPPNYNERMEIRNTWGHNRTDVAVVFLMGTTNQRSLQESLEAERLVCGDMVFARFREHYRNLTLKSMSMLQWVSEYCSKAKFLLKVDDDMYINMPRLLEVLDELNVERKAIYGDVIRFRLPDRKKNSRYFVSQTEYPKDVYPDYILGPSYLLPASLAAVIYEASLTQPFNTMEDVFITGLVAEFLDLKRISVGGFLNSNYYYDDWGSCAIFKAISISRYNFHKYYVRCKELFH